jgi:hypothetical protein
VEYKKNYYNKTADEKERKGDLETQFITLAREEKALAANERLIKASCSTDARLSERNYLDLLRTEDVATVLEKIDMDKDRLIRLDSVAEVDTGDIETVSVEGEVVTTDILGGLSLDSDFLRRTKTMLIEITYPCDMGDTLDELFARLRQHGITWKMKTPEPVF